MTNAFREAHTVPRATKGHLQVTPVEKIPGKSRPPQPPLTEHLRRQHAAALKLLTGLHFLFLTAVPIDRPHRLSFLREIARAVLGRTSKCDAAVTV